MDMQKDLTKSKLAIRYIHKLESKKKKRYAIGWVLEFCGGNVSQIVFIYLSLDRDIHRLQYFLKILPLCISNQKIKHCCLVNKIFTILIIYESH